MSISRETIYTWIYAHPKGGLERAGIVLRTSREQRNLAARRRLLARRSSACAPSRTGPPSSQAARCPDTGKVTGHRRGGQIGDGLVERISGVGRRM
jgi:hypothetical protein